MNSSYVMMIVVVLAIVIVGVTLAPIFINRKRTGRLQSKFGTEYDHTLEVLGDKKQTQIELEGRQEHMKSLDIHPLTDAEHARYLAEWTVVQTKFVDEPGPAIVEADHLIMEVMQLRAYPVSDFEQRAADVSVSYPALVGNYRAARAIAVKNREHQATTEELRQALIYYRSLFTELLDTDSEPVAA